MSRLIPRPLDACRPWRGIEVPGAHETMRILRYGDCSWRENDWGHHFGTRPGYPLVVAERLAARGVSTEFGDVYVDSLTGLPQTREELTSFVRLGAAPDVILLQIGSAHAVRTASRIRSRWWNDLRMQLASHAGPLAVPVYKLLVHPIVRRLGRIATPYPGAERLPRFVELIRQEWPDASIVMMSPSCRAWDDGFFDPAEHVRVWSDIAAHSHALGLEVLDTRDAVDCARAENGVRAVNGLNGYDLRRPGHEVLADELMPFVERQLRAGHERRAAAPATA